MKEISWCQVFSSFWSALTGIQRHYLQSAGPSAAGVSQCKRLPAPGYCCDSSFSKRQLPLHSNWWSLPNPGYGGKGLFPARASFLSAEQALLLQGIGKDGYVTTWRPPWKGFLGHWLLVRCHARWRKTSQDNLMHQAMPRVFRIQWLLVHSCSGNWKCWLGLSGEWDIGAKLWQNTSRPYSLLQKI